MLKPAYHGVHHHISKKHLARYIAQFADKHNIRSLDTREQMHTSWPVWSGVGSCIGTWLRIRVNDGRLASRAQFD